MRELKTIEKVVYEILKANPEARNDDMELYFLVSKEFIFMTHGGNVLLFEDVMRNYHRLGIPCFESVRRTRQKIQARHSDLGCDPEIRRARTRYQKIYRDYALEKNGV